MVKIHLKQFAVPMSNFRRQTKAYELMLNIEIFRRELGSHEFSPRLQLQLLVVGKTSGTSLPLGEQRAPDYRGYRSPSLSASVLLAGSPSIRSPRGGGASPLDASHPSPQPHTTSETPETPLPIHRSELHQRFRGVRSVLYVGVEIHTGVG